MTTESVEVITFSSGNAESISSERGGKADDITVITETAFNGQEEVPSTGGVESFSSDRED